MHHPQKAPLAEAEQAAFEILRASCVQTPKTLVASLAAKGFTVSLNMASLFMKKWKSVLMFEAYERLGVANVGTSEYVAEEVIQELVQKMEENKKKRGRPAMSPEEKARRAELKKATGNVMPVVDKVPEIPPTEKVEQPQVASFATCIEETDASGNVLYSSEAPDVPKAAKKCASKCHVTTAQATQDSVAVEDALMHVPENKLDNIQFVDKLCDLIEQYGTERVLDGTAIYKHFQNK